MLGDKSYSIISDYLGRPAQAYDDKGELVWQVEFDIYGRIRENLFNNKSFIPFRQLGQYEDVETGLYYNRFRYYNPETGSYISKDPIGLAGNNPNLYAYTHDSKTMVDPLGLDIFDSIDWDLPVNTRNGVKTNLDLALEGKAPFIVKDGKYSQINLHHSKQNAKGSLFELSASTHQKYYGSDALHPHLPNAHPDNPVNRDLFNIDREAYWKQRAEAEVNARKLKVKCH